MLIYWLCTVLNCLSIQFSLSKSIEWAPTPGSNTTLSEANIVLLNEDGVIMINQHHGVFQLGPRQQITDLYRYGYNLSNIWSFLGVRVYTIMVVIHKKTTIAKKIGPAMRQFFSLCSIAILSSLQKLHRGSSSGPQKGFAQTPTEVKTKPTSKNIIVKKIITIRRWLHVG